jgi:hypothetical protein
MIKLKDLLKEELITEATRWNVAVAMPNGKVTAVYGHYDGYPEYVGKMLKKYYSQGGKVRDLVKLGKHGISTLDKSMKGGKDHSFDNPKKGETVFYGRDRGEKHNMTSTYKSIDDFGQKFTKSSGAEFGYVWDMKERKWYYFDYNNRKKEL